MGDVVGLVETALEKVNQEEAQQTAQRMLSGQFDLNDLLSQLRQMNKLGDIKGVMKMIPGLSKFQKKIDEADIDQKYFPAARGNYFIHDAQRTQESRPVKSGAENRIANGAGVEVSDVNRLLKQYEQMASVMKKFKKMGPLGMMSMMKKMGAMSGDANLDSLMKQGGNFPPFK